MKSRKALQRPLSNIKRGRPVIPDRTVLKNRTMTICLTPELHSELKRVAVENNQKPAAMARILIQSGVETA